MKKGMDHKQASVSNPNNKNRVTQQSTMAPRAHQKTTTLCHSKPYPCPCCFLLALFVVRLLWDVSECSSLLLSTDNLSPRRGVLTTSVSSVSSPHRLSPSQRRQSPNIIPGSPEEWRTGEVGRRWQGDRGPRTRGGGGGAPRSCPA